MDKWTKKQVVGAVLGGLAIFAVCAFCAFNLVDVMARLLEDGFVIE